MTRRWQCEIRIDNYPQLKGRLTAQSAADYVSIGRDLESQVLARAIHAHIHHRVFLNANRTVVFPASPGSYASGARDDRRCDH